MFFFIIIYKYLYSLPHSFVELRAFLYVELIYMTELILLLAGIKPGLNNATAFLRLSIVP